MEVKINVKDPIVASVINKIAARSNTGIEKYGMTLKDDNKSLEYFLKQVQSELMDATLYLQKLKESTTAELQEALLKSYNKDEAI
jgi:hypothetical protein